MYIKTLFVILVCCIFSHFVQAQLRGTSLAEAKRTKKATITCLYSESPNYITSVPGGSPKGLLTEIMTEFVNHMKAKEGINIQINYQPVKANTPLSETFQAVNTAGDGVLGLLFIFITEERKKMLTFSAPIFNSPSFLLTPNSTPKITSLAKAATQLKGHTAYVNQGNLYDDKFKEIKKKSVPGLQIEYWKSYDQLNISKTLQKEKSMVYVDVAGLLYATKTKLPIRNQELFHFVTPMGIIFSKNTSWKMPFDEFLASGFLKSVQFKKMVSENLGYPTLQLLNL